jgi:hypothetical protein
MMMDGLKGLSWPEMAGWVDECTIYVVYKGGRE